MIRIRAVFVPGCAWDIVKLCLAVFEGAGRRERVVVGGRGQEREGGRGREGAGEREGGGRLSLIHISEPTRLA